MSLEEFKSMDSSNLPVAKLIAMIAKSFTLYVNHHLEKYDLNASQLQLLFEISNNDNLNQDKIAMKCNVNKGSVARSIKKMEDRGFVIREIDENNRRQNKVSLTQKGEETLTEAIKILDEWESEVIMDEGYIEKELLKKVLKEIAVKTMELNQGECKNG